MVWALLSVDVLLFLLFFIDERKPIIDYIEQKLECLREGISFFILAIVGLCGAGLNVWFLFRLLFDLWDTMCMLKDYFKPPQHWTRVKPTSAALLPLLKTSTVYSLHSFGFIDLSPKIIVIPTHIIFMIYTHLKIIRFFHGKTTQFWKTLCLYVIHMNVGIILLYIIISLYIILYIIIIYKYIIMFSCIDPLISSVY